MLRRVIIVSVLSLGLAGTASAEPIGTQNSLSTLGPTYSPAATPFEAFDWTPLDLAAFYAYGGDFANVRKPAMPILFFEETFTAPVPAGPDDELGVVFSLQAYSVPQFEELPKDGEPDLGDPSGSSPADEASVPEPGILALVGIGLLGASSRLRRAYRSAK